MHSIETFKIPTLHNCLTEAYRGDRARLYLEVHSNRMRGNGRMLEDFSSDGGEGLEQFIGKTTSPDFQHCK